MDKITFPLCVVFFGLLPIKFFKNPILLSFAYENLLLMAIASAKGFNHSINWNLSISII